MTIPKNSNFNVSTFFHYYALHPFAKGLSAKQKAFAFIGTIFLALPFGVGLIVCGFLHDKKIALNPDLKEKTKTDDIAEKIGVKKRSAKERYAKNLESQSQVDQAKGIQTGSKDTASTPLDTSPKNSGAKTSKVVPKANKTKASSIEDTGLINNDKKRNFPQIIDTAKKPSTKQLTSLKQKFESDHPIMQEQLLFHEKARTSKEKLSKFQRQCISNLEDLTLINYQRENFQYLSVIIAREEGEREDAVHHLDDRILKRIAFLNEHVQFQDRVDALIGHAHLNQITLRDLELPWNISPLRIALLSDKELYSLPLSEISSFSKKQMDMLGFRLSILEKNINSKTEKVSKSLNGITIGEFISLPDNSIFIKNNFSSFSDQTLMLIPDRSLVYLDLSACSAEQFCALTQAIRNNLTKERFSHFNNSQLYTVSDHFNEDHFYFLSNKQIESWDFDNHPLKREQFNTLFYTRNLEYDKPDNSKVRLLTGPQIHALWPFFDANRAAQISPLQMAELNLKELAKDTSQENIARFNGLFDISFDCIVESKQKAEKIGAAIYECYHLLDGNTLYTILTKEQIQNWDFNKNRLTADQFNGIFNKINLEYDKPDNSKVRLLKGTQIHALWSFFDENRAALISASQILEMNLGELAKDQSAENRMRFIGLFDIGIKFIKESKQKSKNAGFAIYDCYKVIPGGHLNAILDKEQLENWDFKKHPLNKNQFNNIFSRVSVQDKYNPEQVTNHHIRFLSWNQLLDLDDAGQMDQNRAACISKEQVKMIDLESKDTLEFVKKFKVFSLWASYSSSVYEEAIQRIKALSAPQLLTVIDSFESTELFHITNNQFKDLSFNDLLRKGFDFNLFFPRDTTKGWPPYKIQNWAIERLHALEPNKFTELLNCIKDAELEKDLAEAWKKRKA